ncbi:fumarylacetoacetate hydrolase family protein [Rubellicoccus peritrichatus]|uniref:Fumarylacetoacetate hydrolase family protein n=1 Tax=Rubellicoccus peritrichatus TaxID=3080537 RepID=A0AAQ3LAF6_9BACT|nr:fumarylacetoacetate hydrolase family protein [Puniceicoccus sp. CR14]WOO41816.1 fumarylacetoacetate hydrolase family protein [Puniceicoccus sp. CR14]
MKIVRIQDDAASIRYGALQDDGRIFALEGDIYNGPQVTGELLSGELLAPVEPPAILCIGMNYRKHTEELGKDAPDKPVLFIKSNTSLLGPEMAIELPRFLRSDKVDYEAELAVVIGKPCKNATRETALDYVLGYTCANDVSARDWQIEWGGSQFCKGKSFDTFCPLGPCIVTADEIPDPNQLGIKMVLNGKVMQDSNTADMIFDVQTLIAFLSGSTTLLPGTVILTGTPEGVGLGRTPPVFLQAGDSVSVELEGVGKLANPVIEESV